MNDTLRNKMMMIGKVVVFFETGGGDALYPLATGLNAKETALKAIYDSMPAEDSAANQDDTGISEMVAAMRATLTQNVRRVGNAAINYYRDNNMTVIKERINLRAADLENANEAEFIRTCVDVFVNADPIKALLVTYNGVTAAEVTAINASLTSYRLAAPQVLEARGGRKGHNVVLNSLFEQADVLLDTIDEVMELFRDDHVQLYEEYKASRLIDDYTGPGSSHTYNGSVPGMTSQFIADVTMDTNLPMHLEVNTPGAMLIFELHDIGGVIIGSQITINNGNPQSVTLGAFAPAVPADAQLFANNPGPNPVVYEVVIG